MVQSKLRTARRPKNKAGEITQRAGSIEEYDIKTQAALAARELIGDGVKAAPLRKDRICDHECEGVEQSRPSYHIQSQ